MFSGRWSEIILSSVSSNVRPCRSIKTGRNSNKIFTVIVEYEKRSRQQPQGERKKWKEHNSVIPLEFARLTNRQQKHKETWSGSGNRVLSVIYDLSRSCFVGRFSSCVGLSCQTNEARDLNFEERVLSSGHLFLSSCVPRVCVCRVGLLIWEGCAVSNDKATRRAKALSSYQCV